MSASVYIILDKLIGGNCKQSQSNQYNPLTMSEIKFRIDLKCIDDIN